MTLKHLLPLALFPAENGFQVSFGGHFLLINSQKLFRLAILVPYDKSELASIVIQVQLLSGDSTDWV